MTSVRPAFLFSNYGGDVVLRGSDESDKLAFGGWQGSLRCRFGLIHTATALHINNSAIICQAPPHIPAMVRVYISSNGVDYTATEQIISYVQTPKLLSFTPKRGSSMGRQDIAIRVDGMPMDDFGFARIAVCYFGDVPSTSSSSMITSNATHVLCTTPPHVPGDVSLSLGWPRIGMSNHRFYVNGNQDNKGIKFTYFEMPRVTRVRPQQGSAQGGTNVIVYGSGFQSSEHLACRFDDGSAFEQARWINSSSIECRAPSHHPGKVNLRVTNDGIVHSSRFVVFEYMSMLNLLSSSPPIGPKQGGTTVLLSGTNFHKESELKCQFGHTIVSAIFVNTTSIFCISPRLVQTTGPFSTGASEHSTTLRVSRNGEEFLTRVGKPLTFGYYSPPVVTKLWPNRGLATERTKVILTGTGFISSSRIRCRLQTLASASSLFEEGEGRYISPTEIECTIGATGVPHTYMLELALNGHDFTPAFLKFTSYATCDVESASPALGTEMGGTPVLISGHGFQNVDSIRCRFGSSSSGSTVVAEWISSSLVRCISPAAWFQDDLRTVQVAVSNNGISFAGTSSASFRYHPAVIVRQVVPHNASLTGGTEVRIYASNLASSGALSCQFGSVHVIPAVLVKANGIRGGGGEREPYMSCLTPSMISPASMRLLISNNGVDMLDTAVKFEFTGSTTERAATLRMHPRFGSIYGGTVVTFDNGTLVDVGVNARDPLICRFVFRETEQNDVIVPAVRNTLSRTTECVTPVSESGPAAVLVELVHSVDMDTLIGSASYRYILPLAVHQVSPTFGSLLSDGTRLLVRGVHFLNSSLRLQCRLGEASEDSLVVAARFLSSNLIECNIPQAPSSWQPQDYAVYVSNNGVDFSSKSAAIFTYTAVATISSMSPKSGPRSGGTLVSVHGHNFRQGKATCQFTFHGNMTESVRARVSSETQLQCETPPLQLGQRNGEGDSVGDRFSHSSSLQVTLNGFDFLLTNDDARHGPIASSPPHMYFQFIRRLVVNWAVHNSPYSGRDSQMQQQDSTAFFVDSVGSLPQRLSQ